MCEGASEVGFLRGLDQFLTSNGGISIYAHGTTIVDGHGGDSDSLFKRAEAFRALGYWVAIVRDDDITPTEGVEATLVANGGKVVTWRDERTLEDELFFSLTDEAVRKLIDRAVELNGEELVNEHIKTASLNVKDLQSVYTEALIDGFTSGTRSLLGKAARTKKAGWFKSVTRMENIARDIVGPDLAGADLGFRTLVEEIFAWASNAEG